MTLDFPHMIATAVLLLAVLYGIKRTSAYRNATGAKRFGLVFGPLFVVVLVFNLIWPYGS